MNIILSNPSSEICESFGFGIAWPFSIYKSFTTGEIAGKSIYFLFAVLMGYVAGTIHKVLSHPDVVLGLYTLNTGMVMLDIVLYLRNRKRLLARMRKQPRRIVHLCVHLRFGDSSKFRLGFMRNLSIGGMFVRTSEPPAVGETVEARFRLQPYGALISIKGRVVHQVPLRKVADRHLAGFGIEFLNVSPGAKEAINGFVRQTSTENIEPEAVTRVLALLRPTARAEFFAALGLDEKSSADDVKAALKEFLIEYDPLTFLGKLPVEYQLRLNEVYERIYEYAKVAGKSRDGKDQTAARKAI